MTNQSTRLAACWKITRTDGTIFRFTSHDKTLTFSEGTFTPVGGVEQSAKRRENAFKDHTTDFRGVLSDDAITDEDLQAGRYDDAQIDEYLIPWMWPWIGAVIQHRFWVDRCVHNGEFWQAELSGATRWLDHDIGTVLGRTCDNDLGDSRCQVNLASFTVSTVHVDGMSDGRSRLIIRANGTDLSGSFADSYFKGGKVTFTSGLNNGLIGEIKSYSQTSREITLQLPMPYDVAVNDTFNITAGCDKLSSTCITKFANILNFRGSKFMPGTDNILKSPTR